jgi:hypothetical protein
METDTTSQPMPVEADNGSDPVMSAPVRKVVYPPFPKMQSVYSGYFRTRITYKTAEELFAEYDRSRP